MRVTESDLLGAVGNEIDKVFPIVDLDFLVELAKSLGRGNNVLNEGFAFRPVVEHSRPMCLMWESLTQENHSTLPSLLSLFHR